MTTVGLSSQIMARTAASPREVWTPSDFVDLGSRAAVDKALQRLCTTGTLARIDRGLYALPRQNPLTGRISPPDYRAVISAVLRRDNLRTLLDGVSAANDLGLTNAVPAHVVVLVDARLRPIRLGRQVIRFKQTAPSRLYWAGRPAMRIVQALAWLRDTLDDDTQRDRVRDRIRALLDDPVHGKAMRDDLRAGWGNLPIWTQDFLRDLVLPAASSVV